LSGAAVVIRKQNRYIQKFKDSGAISESNARPLKEMGIKEDYIFRSMVKRGVFIGTEGEKYYINLNISDEFIIKRSRFLIIIFVALVVFCVIYYALSWN
jgi:hypothetical protein